MIRDLLLVLATIALTACNRPNGAVSTAGADAQVTTFGTIEVTARLVEIPDGAIFQRDLYDYATILKKGAILYVGQYNPWKPRSEAADKRALGIGGNLRRFQAGQLHRLALAVPMDDHFMGGIVDKYFGQHTGPAYWALWTNVAD